MDAKERNRIRTASRRASLTPDQKQKQKEIQRIRALERRRNESLTEKLLRRERERQNASKRRLAEPPEKREERLKIGRERAQSKRRGESPGSRERRLRKSRERLATRRKLIREGKRIDDLRKGPRQQFNESKMDTCLIGDGLGNDDDISYYNELLPHVQSVSDHLPLVIASCSTESHFNILNKVLFGNLEPFSQDIESETNTLERNSTQINEMNRLLQKPSSQQPSRQLQQMLSLSSIQAQEQQVTSLRELLRQEEDRLEMLKKMRGSSPSETAETIRGGVIRSSESVGSHILNNGSQSISSRLQQLVDSVAVDQIGSKYSHNSRVSSRKNEKQFNSGSPEVITISDSPSPASPPALISTNHVPGVIQVPTIASSHSVKLDEAAILKTIENSRRYRDFIMKQSNLKRNFQKQIDKKIANAPYPKTFRQVWPIIPVQDPSFVKHLGLETVTQFFEQGTHTKSPPVSKVKPICNQCGCDFASAWQIRKNNAKQVLLCESCDFTNLKLLQRTKLATQLKEIVENIRKDEDKFNTECEDARKQIIALERSSILSSAQKSLNNKASNNGSQAHANHVTTRHTVVDVTKSNEMKRPTIPSILTSRGGYQIQERVYSTLETSRKRPSDQDYAAPSRKSAKTSSNLDHTLSRITQQLLRKQVDEKVQQHRQQHSPSPTPHVMTTKTPPPPLEQMDVHNHTPSPNPPEPKVLQSTPPPLTSVSPSVGDNRRSRRKGQPRQNRQTSSSSDI